MAFDHLLFFLRLYDPVTNLYTVQPDAFFHKYVYDAENRLTDVYTALTENAPLIQQDHDAYYQYYKHGPLARTVLGQNQVQGLDYMYTIHGWLKGVNGSAVNSLYDAGQDGATTGANRLVARDAFGFSLQYYAYDYIPVYNGIKTLVNVINTLGTTIAKPLYNGNISNMVVNIPALGNAQVNNYTYDQLNRLTAMDPYDGFKNTDNTFTPVASTNYKERISYDPNGNILTYARNGAAASKPMDALTYNYKANTNQLDYVADAIAATTYTEDIDNQAAANYTYDKIGNLVKDNAEGISNITWTVYGKIDKITKTDGTVIQYAYDATGNRISKAVTKAGQTTSTFYVRDAQGNTMAVYEQNSTVNSGHFTLDEQYMYGSSRLGVYNAGKDLTLPANTPINLGSSQSAVLATFERGKKFFELSNHLGNALVTIRDDKKAVASNNTIAYYTANVVSANDYYPFGMQMPGRKFNAGMYRYGFNGKEDDNDVKGQGNQQDYGMRIYDPRVGKFLSVDPITKKYPELTPYQYAGNKPIWCIDLDGLEDIPTTVLNKYGEKQVYEITTTNYIGEGWPEVVTTKIAPKNATPITQNMSEIQIYKMAVARMLIPGGFKIADNQYLDEKYLAVQEKVNYYFSHLATSTMVDTKEMRELTLEMNNKVIEGLFNADEKTSNTSFETIKRRTSFFGKRNIASDAIMFFQPAWVEWGKSMNGLASIIKTSIPRGFNILADPQKWKTVMTNITEQAALRSAMSGEGVPIMGSGTTKALTDPRLAGYDITKYELVHTGRDVLGKEVKTIIHYLKNNKTGDLFDFKFTK